MKNQNTTMNDEWIMNKSKTKNEKMKTQNTKMKSKKYEEIDN